MRGSLIVTVYFECYSGNLRSESAFFYFIFDPAIVYDYFKTKLTNEELDEGGRCSHLKKFSEKFQIAECCITDLPEGLRHSDFPKRSFLYRNKIILYMTDMNQIICVISYGSYDTILFIRYKLYVIIYKL